MPKEFVLVAPRDIVFREYEEPPLKPNEVRLRTIISGVKTGTELNLYRGTTPFLDNRFDPEYRLFLPRTSESKENFWPHYLGSWGVAEVIEVGKEVTQFRVGDRVHGGIKHRPTSVMPADKLYPLGSLKPEAALFTDPSIFALTSCHDAGIKVGDRVAIFGMGVIGLIAVQIARMEGAREIFAVDLYEKRLKMAKQLGANVVLKADACDAGLEIKKMTGKRGVDVAIEISGAYAGLQQAIRCVHVGGVVVAAAYYGGPGTALCLGAEWHHNRITMRSSMAVWGCPHRCYPMWDLSRIEETVIWLWRRDT